MDNIDRIILTVIMFGVGVLLLSITLQVSDIRTSVNNINPIINEQICEEILPYKFRGRQHFVCYKGDSLEYSTVELEIINEWKQFKTKGE